MVTDAVGIKPLKNVDAGFKAIWIPRKYESHDSRHSYDCIHCVAIKNLEETLEWKNLSIFKSTMKKIRIENELTICCSLHVFIVWIIKLLIRSNIHIHVWIHHIIWSLHSHHWSKLILLLGLKSKLFIHFMRKCLNSYEKYKNIHLLPGPVVVVNVGGYCLD